MKLDAFREAVLQETRAAADETLAHATHEAGRQIEDARRRATGLLERARHQGREAAMRQTRDQVLERRRQAREQVLRARSDALRRLRDRVIQRLRDAQAGGDGKRLRRELEAMVHDQLGPQAKIEHEAEAGGLIGRADRRLVDYRIPQIVDRAMDEMGAELEQLWS